MRGVADRERHTYNRDRHLLVGFSVRPFSDYPQAPLEAAPSGLLTLVAHSSGGLVATELAAMATHRMAGVLAIAAIIPLPGRSFTSSLPFPQRLVLPVVLRLIGTKPPETDIRGLARGAPALQATYAASA